MSKCPFCEVSCGNDHCSYAPVKVEYPAIMNIGKTLFYQNYTKMSELAYKSEYGPDPGEVETVIQDEQTFTLGVF